MKKDSIAMIVRTIVKEIIKPVTPIAVQAMSEQELIVLISSYPKDGTPSDVIEAYNALRRINSVKYREINFDLEYERVFGTKSEEPYFWDRPENRDITPGTL